MPILPKYLEHGDYPLMQRGEGYEQCGDNYGHAECPNCDAGVISEGEEYQIGHKCWRCGAAVVGTINSRTRAITLGAADAQGVTIK